MKAVLIRVNGFVTVEDFPYEEKLQWYYKKIGCDCIDIVKPYGIETVVDMYGLKAYMDKFCLIVDDEGMLKDNPKVNPIASLLYGADDHGQVLFGDVLVAKDEETEDGIETVGLDDSEVMLLKAAMNTLIEMHNEKVNANE